jgi:hypothetical protein
MINYQGLLTNLIRVAVTETASIPEGEAAFMRKAYRLLGRGGRLSSVDEFKVQGLALRYREAIKEAASRVESWQPLASF